MSGALLLVLLAGPGSAPATAAELAASVQASLVAASGAWTKSLAAGARDGAVTLSLSIDAQGRVVELGLVHAAATNALDDAARVLVLSAEPFSPPTAGLLAAGARSSCLVRVATRGRSQGSADLTVGCFALGVLVASVVGLSDAAKSAADPGAQLLLGYLLEAHDAAAAEAAYKRALAQAPELAWASRALARRAARPVESTAPGGPDFAGCQRSELEVNTYVREHFGAIADCFRAERQRLPPSVGFPDHVPVTFIIGTDGLIRNVSADHRHFREGPVATCVATALVGQLPPAGGADCPGQFNVDLRGM